MASTAHGAAIQGVAANSQFYLSSTASKAGNMVIGSVFFFMMSSAGLLSPGDNLRGAPDVQNGLNILNPTKATILDEALLEFANRTKPSVPVKVYQDLDEVGKTARVRIVSLNEAVEYFDTDAPVAFPQVIVNP